MHALLADFIKQVHAQPGRIGQRPMPREAEIDFEGLLYGDDNNLPLVEILPKLMNQRGVSERALVKQLYMARTQFQRLLRGEYEPDVSEIKQIAAALGVAPVYFVEYRQIMATAAFVSLITERPGIATMLYRKYLEVRLK
jgi:transcriptional regulator with XRE-family HTH domain